MTQDAGKANVIEDGVERHPKVGRAIPWWAWLTIGITVGLGLGIVLSNPSAPETADQSTADVTLDSITPSVTPDTSLGIAETIPGFPDALTVVWAKDGQSLGHVVWPVAGSPVSRTVPGGDLGNVSFDASGSWLAVTTRVRDSDGFVLSMGRPESVEPLALEVTSFAWHDSHHAALSYTQVVAGDWALFEVGADRRPREITRAEGITGDVAAWGEWGWVIQGPDSVTLITALGEIWATYDGRALGSHPSGWVLVDHERLKLVSPGGLVTTPGINIEGLGVDGNAALSPDGEMIALIGTGGLMVSAIDTDEEAFFVAMPTGLHQVAWSSDSRFVIFPWVRGAIVLDVAETGRSFHILTDRLVRAVGVTSASGA